MNSTYVSKFKGLYEVNLVMCLLSAADCDVTMNVMFSLFFLEALKE